MDDMVGASPAICGVFEKISKVAATEMPVLLTGETGTGKELTAQAIHARSVRKQGPFVPINCAAIPETLLESELFGHERGAFTGAVQQKKANSKLQPAGLCFLMKSVICFLPCRLNC
ncbi:MAG: sigma 54-interacting transcriptional regulator [Nitrospira sp.]|nr:sigma 54-interacting transcriptional regulator [Nitrospira sp.]